MNRLALCAAALLVTGAAQAITNTAPVVPIPAKSSSPKLDSKELADLTRACLAIAGAKVVDTRCVAADGRAVSSDALKQARENAPRGND